MPYFIISITNNMNPTIQEIESNARMIEKIILDTKEITFAELVLKCSLEASEIYMAMGWLLNENKNITLKYRNNNMFISESSGFYYF